MNIALIIVGVIVFLIFFIVLFFALNFKKAPTDQAFVVSGLFPSIFIGKGKLVLPILQRVDKLQLSTFGIDVKSVNEIPTKEYLNIKVDANAVCKIGSSQEMLKRAAENFLNKDTNSIIEKLQEILSGNVREIVGQMELQEMISNKKAFAEKVLENVVPDLEKMGIELVSFTVQDFTDKTGIIKSLGEERAAAIQTKAVQVRAKAEAEQEELLSQTRQRKAQADKEAAIVEAQQKAEASAEQARASARATQAREEANIAALTSVAIKDNELQVKQAELKEKTDKAKAIADAAFNIQQQAERKALEIRQAEADLERQERTVAIREREAKVEEMRLEAEVKKKAEAERYRREQLAEADKKERELEASAQLTEAKAKADSMKLEAEARKIEGLAEAEAIRAKGLAEADAIEKKAEAMNKMEQAAILEMVIGILPEMAAAIAAPMASIDKVTIFGSDANGVSSMSDNVAVNLAKTLDTVKDTTGVDISKLLTAPVEQTRNINLGVENEEIQKALLDSIEIIADAKTNTNL